MPPLSAIAAFWSKLGEENGPAYASAYAETEIYTNTMPYAGAITVAPPFEGFFLCGIKIKLIERNKAEPTKAVKVNYINKRLDEPITWLHQRVMVGDADWTPTIYPIPCDVIRGTKLAIELEGAAGATVMVKFLYVSIQDLVSKHGWAFVDDRGGLQQFSMFTHESYWLSISQIHKLGASSFPVAPTPAIPSMRRLLAGFNEEQRLLEAPDSSLWGPVSLNVGANAPVSAISPLT
jgi:hypothetical protein